MNTIEAIIVQQKAAEDALDKVILNFGKEPKDRLRNVIRLNSWIPKITEQWSTITENHKILLKDHQKEEVKQYIMEFQFEKVEKKAKETVDKINKFILKAKREEANAASTSQKDNPLPKQNKNTGIEGNLTINNIESDDSDDETNGNWINNDDNGDGGKNFNNSNESWQNDDQVYDISTPLGKMIKHYLAKVKLFKRILTTAEENIQNSEFETVQMQEKFLKDRFDDLATDLDGICRLSDEPEQFFEEHVVIEQRYLKILKGINRTYVDDSIEPVTLKLKPVQIPQFAGNLQDWPTFSELFSSLIIKNRTINDVQRMQYLKTSLAGNAAKVIKQLEITGNNFHIAWKLLQTRYENKRILTGKCLDMLFDQPKMIRENASYYQQFLDTTRECMSMITEVTTEQVVLHILTQKLNRESMERYESMLRNPKELQSMDEFYNFLEQRIQVCQSFKTEEWKRDKKPFFEKTFNESCECCNEKHALYKCEKFKKLTINERMNMVKAKELCILCLGSKHNAASCKLRFTCRECDKKHNTLLHFKKTEPAIEQSKNKGFAAKKSFVSVTNEGENNQEEEKITCVLAEQPNSAGVLLATAQVRIKTKYGWSEEVCALIDQGSMATFVSEKVVNMLKLQRKNNNVSISGIGGATPEKTLGTTVLEFTARYPTQFKAKTSAIILRKLASLAPVMIAKEKIAECDEFGELVLADPHLNKAFKIDVILGADVFSKILMHGVIKAEKLDLVAQETQLGWIVSGIIDKNQNKTTSISLVATIDEVHESMQKFWEIEEIQEENFHTEEEQKCINHFMEHTYRNDEGRYVVTIPFNEDVNELGNSRRNALAQLLHQERKFQRDPALHQQYMDFIDEYIRMGHMVECGDSDIEKGYYLPHHAVLKESTTTKLRVVFDASRKTSTGISLNDCMMNGPRLQDDLVNIILRFRLHEIAFTADIAKMYRQILVADEQQDYQRILWRKNKGQNIKEYKLTTVTYGTSNAPYLAVQSLVNHAKSEEDKFPEASKIIQKIFYMDDLMGSCDSLEKAVRVQKEITEILARAKFPLRKWSSNNANLLSVIPIEHQEGALTDGEASIATLGLRWFNYTDQFGFKMNNFKEVKCVTKRVILSEITKMYDPLGLLAPFTILCKILMQKLWIADIAWDDKVPQHIATEWENYKSQIPILLNFRINRWINFHSDATLELHGFSDASEMAYGATIYAKIIYKDNIYCNIIASKTRVAPLSKQSLPRLELSAALLLAQLMDKIAKALDVPIESQQYYSDSEITLAWIRGSPRKWETFVGNRVAKIQQLSKIEEWEYVNTKENPADIASRGMIPEELIKSDLWWHGPRWLLSEKTKKTEKTFETTLGLRKMFIGTHILHDESLINRFSSLNKATRTLAFCNRFVTNSKKGDSNTERNSSKNLTVDELNRAKMALVKLCQKIHFTQDLEYIKENGEVSFKSKLKTLYPFIDSDGILRVGGRLQNSQFNFDKKHPVILPYKSALTNLVIDAAHKKVLHGGNQLTTMQIRHEYWIIGCKRAVKSHIYRCIKCHRFKALSAKQLMGSLPSDRTLIGNKPFTVTGTDFCGPFQMRMSKNGRLKAVKGYVCVFICFSTRAIHLEVVSDLTAEAFIAAFKRFVSRRGNVLKLYSDNGGNFVKARKILEIDTEDALKEFNECIKSELANFSTKFYFNPPSAPWFGGLWERSVGSVKFHLKRTIGERILTFEELTTIINQIEACLNSRPLVPINENPDNLEVLTPGHFLIGGAITAPITPSLINEKENRLTRWQLCERIKQEFWQNWSNEYIANLQKRTKWQQKHENLKIGDIVLIKDEINPPLRWPLARVTKIFPGKDELVRVVEVSTGSKTYKRPVGKLSKLPIDDEIEKNLNENLSSTENISVTDKTVKSNLTKTRKQTRSKTKAASVIAMFCLVLTLQGVYSKNLSNEIGYKIQNFEGEPVIYFEKIDEIHRKHGTWRILSVMDFRPYRENFKTLIESVYELEHLCTFQRTKSAENACHEILKQIDQNVRDIKIYDKIISEECREKREIMTGVTIGGGMLLGWGASKIIDLINDSNNDDLKERTRRLEQLLKEQTSVLTMTEKIMRKNQEIMNAELSLLINQTAILFDHVDKLTRNTEMAERAQWISTHLLLMLNEFQTMQKLLLEIIINNEKKLQSSWLKPDKIEKQIQIIEENIKNESLMGKTLHEKIKMFYYLANTQTIIGKNELILVVEVPLMSQKSYEWYKMYAVPIKSDEQHAWVKLKHNNFIVNKAHTEYSVIPDKSIIYQNYFEQAIMEKVNENNTQCEAEVFLLHKNLDMCHFHFKKASESWQKMFTINTFLFTMCNETKLHIDCGQEGAYVTIFKHGIIMTTNQCVIKTQMYELTTQFFGRSTEMANLNKLPKLGNYSQNNSFSKFNVSITNLIQVNKALEILQNKQGNIEFNFQEQVHMERILGILALAVIIVLITLLVIQFKCRNS